MTALTRRRFLTISAACTAMPMQAVSSPSAHWRGSALGAPASLRLEGLSDAQASPMIAAVEAELNRLENIFSLYRPGSELCRLNRDGRLLHPSPELLNVLSMCTVLHDASGGVFDPTIQPLWAALAMQSDKAMLDAARETMGWHNVHVARDEIRLPKPGSSALTLNGIAQGAITDRIAAVLGSMGLHNVLVDMGEIAARGRRGDGAAWRVGLSTTGGTVVQRIRLSDRAIATSAPYSMELSVGQGHILNPVSPALPHHTVSVSAPTAALADGLSTALCGVPQSRLDSVIERFKGARIEMVS